MKVAITGHRPDKLGNWNQVADAILKGLYSLSADHVYIGMAPGADLLAARACTFSWIPYTAVIPWAGHRGSIPEEWLSAYDSAIDHAKEVVILDDSMEYNNRPWLYHNRNKYMVDHADVVVAIWDGSDKGGTASTVKYAMSPKVDKAVYGIHPTTFARNIVHQEV